MNADTALFLNLLFAHGQFNDIGAYVTLTAIHPDGCRPTPSHHIPVGNINVLQRSIERLMVANRHGWGGYIGIATRRPGLGRWTRGGKTDLLALPALFVDIDDPGWALWQLTFFDLPPSLVIHSGRGYHAYWILATPTNDFHSADRAIKGLAHALHGDPVLTVAQSMRLPGTTNTKPGRDQMQCSIVHCNPGHRYALNDFSRYFPDESHYSPPRFRWYPRDFDDLEPPGPLIELVTNAVIHSLEGHPRSNGFIAARCPLPHQIDRPGMHFSYHVDSGVGFCFGKHGKIPLQEMCHLLGTSNVNSKW